MTTNGDYSQYAKTSEALAWRKEADEAHAAGRFESLRQAVLSGTEHGTQIGAVFSMPLAVWLRIVELAALLPPEGGEDE